MKNISTQLSLIFLTWILVSGLSASAQNYTWKKGSNAINQPGSYGTPMVAGPNNKPGAREGASSWKDNSGNFWLFGGFGYSFSSPNELNDLWKYNPSTNQWAYMKGDSLGGQSGVYGSLGITSAVGRPGARNKAVSWVDASGNFWLFGGNGYDGAGAQGMLNDLWKYDVTSNQWTWMKGSNLINQSGLYGTMGTGANANRPGAREGAVSWTDQAGNLWLFGGFGLEATSNLGQLNDLWMYNTSSGQWTWVRGSSSYDQNGTYGTLGTPSSLNNPGGRRYSTGWTDASGNLWLFGGYGYPATGALTGHLNDLWRFNIVANQWTWVKGSNTYDQLGVYGTQGTASPANYPGSRVGAKGWSDASGNLWLFGGGGMGAIIQTVDYMNDLWQYNITANSWTWVRGGNTISQAGVYGTQGIPAVGNTPGGRTFLSGWIDSGNSLWLFGGSGYDTNSQTSSGFLNDLWKFGSCTSQNITIAANPIAICPGGTATLTANGAGSYSWSTGQSGTTITVSPSSNIGYSVQSADPNGCGNSASANIGILVAPVVNAMSSMPMACVGAQVQISALGANSYTWSNGQNTALITVIATNTVYTVTGSGSNGCTGTATVSQSAVVCTGIEKANNRQNLFSILPNPSQGEFMILGPGVASLTIINALGQVALKKAEIRSGEMIRANLAKGIYYVLLEDDEHRQAVKKLVIE
ncbi:MAG: kelch repeat-containing protein [Bacteroidota bacterium]